MYEGVMESNIASSLYTNILNALVSKHGHQIVIKPDISTLRGYARGALVCEQVYNETRKAFAPVDFNANQRPDPDPDNGASEFIATGGEYTAPVAAKGPY